MTSRIILIHGKARSGKDTVADHIANTDNYTYRFAFANALKELVIKLVFEFYGIFVSRERLDYYKNDNLRIWAIRPALLTLVGLFIFLSGSIYVSCNLAADVQIAHAAEIFGAIAIAASMLCAVNTRSILQRVGGILREIFGKDIFSNVIINKIREAEVTGHGRSTYIVTDCRFIDEVTAVVTAFSGSLEIHFVHITRNVKSNLTAAQQNDVSEKPLDVSSYADRMNCISLDNNGTLSALRFNVDAAFRR